MTDAQHRLVTENLGLVHSLVHRMFPRHRWEEAVAEGYYYLTRSAVAFDPNRGHQFSTYAYVSIQKGLIRFRSGYAPRPQSDTNMEDMPDRCPNTTDEQVEALERILSRVRLTPLQKETLLLREIDGASFQDMADYFGVTTQSVRTKYYRSLEILRREYGLDVEVKYCRRRSKVCV